MLFFVLEPQKLLAKNPSGDRLVFISVETPREYGSLSVKTQSTFFIAGRDEKLFLPEQPKIGLSVFEDGSARFTGINEEFNDFEKGDSYETRRMIEKRQNCLFIADHPTMLERVFLSTNSNLKTEVLDLQVEFESMEIQNLLIYRIIESQEVLRQAGARENIARRFAEGNTDEPLIWTPDLQPAFKEIRKGLWLPSYGVFADNECPGVLEVCNQIHENRFTARFHWCSEKAPVGAPTEIIQREDIEAAYNFCLERVTSVDPQDFLQQESQLILAKVLLQVG